MKEKQIIQQFLSVINSAFSPSVIIRTTGICRVHALGLQSAKHVTTEGLLCVVAEAVPLPIQPPDTLAT